LLSKSKFIKQKEYWLNKLAGDIAETKLEGNNGSKRTQLKKSDAIHFEKTGIALNGGSWHSIVKLSKDSDLSIYLILLAALKILIYRYTACEDVTIISPVCKLNTSKRTLNNFLFIRDQVTGEKTFKELLLEINTSVMEAYNHQDYPLKTLTELLFPGSEAVNERLISDIGCSLASVHNGSDISKIGGKLSFAFVREEGRLAGNILYDPTTYNKNYIEQLFKHFNKILDIGIRNANMKIGEISFLSDRERRQLLIDFNNNSLDFPRHKTVSMRFEEQVKKNPDRIALVYENSQVTYDRLNSGCNHLAQILRNRGIETDKLVGILMDRSLFMVESILAVWKAGAAYIPLDPAYPVNRIAGILKDSSAGVLLTTSQHTHPVLEREFKEKIIQLDRPPDLIAGYDGEEIEFAGEIDMSSLAYVIYTSGSTGAPKGAMVEQLGMMNHIQAKICDFQATEQSIIAQNASHIFDISIWQFFTALVVGGKTVIYSNSLVLEPEGFIARVMNDRVTILEVVPSYLSVLLEHLGKGPAVPLALDYLLVTGETVKPLLVKNWFDIYPGIKMMNAYGPTEAADDITHYTMDKDPGLERIPIGSTLHNLDIHIVDKNWQLCPVGVKGEICVSGIGVGRGYLNKPELTAEKFLTSPFTLHSPPLYKTGDLGCWLPEGNIDFFGRKDYQVKIRGFRIELGEIERNLVLFEKIKEAVVIDREDKEGNKYICAYIVTTPGSEDARTGEPQTLHEELYAFLSERLPDYMIPEYFVAIENIPLTPNGKTDRKALPEPEAAAGKYYTPPGSKVEKMLQEIWSQVLGIEKVKISVHNDFFQLGGHSLKVTQLVSRIYKTLNVKIPLAEVFDHPTIRGLAEYINKSAAENFVALKPVEKKEYYKLSSTQKRLYILQQLDIDNTGYNMPGTIKLNIDVDIPKLEQTFRALIERHESLRTSFEKVDDIPVQKIVDQVPFEIEHYTSSGCSSGDLSPAAIIRDFVQPFDLAKAPLIRVGLLNTPGENILMVDMHHIISDGISHIRLEEEFTAIYNENELPPLRLQYKDYAEWQNSPGQQQKIKDQGQYWLDICSSELPVLDLPIDFPRPAVQGFEGDSINFELSRLEREHLARIADETGTTLFMVILSIYNVLLSKWSGQEDIVIGTPIAARRHPDLEGIIGMFVNMLALRNFPSGYKTFKEFLKEVKEKTLEAYENQEYQFEDLVDRLSVRRDTSRNPLFDVVFNYFDQEEAKNDVTNAGGEDDYQYKNKTAKFDLTLRAMDLGERLLFNLEYSTTLFKRDTMERFIGYFKQMVSGITAGIEVKLADIEILPGTTREQKLKHFNEDLKNTAVQPLQVKLAKSFLEFSGNTAIEYGEAQVTYGELEKQAAQVTLWISGQHIKKGSLIGIYIEDKIDIISAILGSLYAGCVFVPLDTQLPMKRIEAMIRFANIQTIITDTANQDRLSHIRETIPGIGSSLIIDDSFYKRDTLNVSLSGTAHPDRALRIDNDDSIYVYFTSGTTGTPLAMIGKNESLAQFVEWEIETFSVDSTCRISQLAAVGFDAFLRNVFTPLCAGATVCIPGSRELVMDSQGLVKWLDNSEINLVHCVPGVFRLIQSGAATNRLFHHLKYILMSGEHINPGPLKEWYDIFGDRIQLVNCYGATETTIIKTCHFIRGSDIQKGRIPAGLPIHNTRLILLDRNKKVCAPGVVGEIYIRTPYRSFGYLNDSQLTTERFIQNPFNRQEPDIIYKTGDLGRELPGGEIEVLGRVDRQVKIRGIRIETEGIEYALETNHKIEKSIVTQRKDEQGDNYLCAYFLPKKQEQERAVLAISSPRQTITDLNAMPIPDRSLVNYQKYAQYIGQSLVKHSISLLGSRGCPFKCAYCHKIWPKKQISRSAENIFNEVQLYYSIGFKRFVFLDDIFNLDVKNTIHFFELIIKNGMDIQMCLNLRGDILSKEYIDLMVKAGVIRVAFALETASPRLQKLIGKNLNLQHFKENMEYICEIHPQVILEINTMHGFPTETEDEAMATLNFIKDLKWVHFPYINILKIYPNTEMENLALAQGISQDSINNSAALAYHELPDTLPFEKSFTLKYQLELMGDYFLAKERLLHVLPHQLKVLTGDEIVQKYNSYLPVKIGSIDDLLEFTNISKQELDLSLLKIDDYLEIPDLNQKIRDLFPVHTSAKNTFSVLLLDLSQFFSADTGDNLYDVVEAPLGLMYLMAYLNKHYKGMIQGKIAKSRIDFDDYDGLKSLLDEFKPDVIGIRTLTYFKEFFHRTVAVMRHWGVDVPIIAGGPYASSDYETILQDKNIDLAVLGEGEVTLKELIGAMLENNGKLPCQDRLKDIPGIALALWKGGSGYNSTERTARPELPDTQSPTLTEPAVNPLELREYLSNQLPEYMIPSYFVPIDEVPLTPNGKIDWKRLPDPGYHIRQEYQAPRGILEKKLAAIWSEVLKVDKEKISRDANFFELGGHSLKATILTAKIHQELAVKVPLVEIFKTNTMAELAGYIKNSVQEKHVSIDPVEKKEYYRLSSAQSRLYILQQMDPDSTAYNIFGTIYPDQQFETERLEETFIRLIERHESLRTSFVMVNGIPVQKISDRVPFAIEHYDLPGLEIETRNAEDELMHRFVQPFDLGKAPLFRVGLIKTAGMNILLVDMHHIISDGKSHDVLREEFQAIYERKKLPVLNIQYKDYALWQTCDGHQNNIKLQEQYWLSEFSTTEELPVLNLSTDYPRPAIQSFEGNTVGFTLNPTETGIIKNIARETDSTLFMVTLSIYNILLAKLSGQEDIIIGSPIEARRHTELQRIIGMFVNILPLRLFPAADKSAKQFIRESRKRILDAFENQEYQFEDLVDRLSIVRDASRNPIFDLAFSLVNQVELTSDMFERQKSQDYIHKRKTAKFDVTLRAYELEDCLYFSFEYCIKLFKPSTIERFIDYFRAIIAVLGLNLQTKIADIEIISREEKKQLLFEFNNTVAGYPEDKTIHELFEEQVAKTPDNIAVIGQSLMHTVNGEDMHISYRELNKKSTHLARLLRSKGVLQADTIVALIVERYVEMIWAILGILKAGGTYLPIDPKNPKNRVLSILQDCQAAVVLTQNHLLGISGHGDPDAITYTALLGAAETEPTLRALTVTPRRPQIRDFDALPFPNRSLVDYEKYNRYIGQAMVSHAMALQATRGCPYNCLYCHKIWPKKHIYRSAENIFQEVELYYNMGVRRFVFIDDIFNFNPKNSRRFFELIVQKGLEVQLFFPNGMRGDLLTKDYIDLMVKAGTVSVALALETASPRLQKLIKKNLNLERLRENIEYLCTTYPHVILELFTMHGFPTETEEEARMTLDFINRLKWLHFPYVHVLKIYPDTGMEELALQSGIRRDDILSSMDLSYHELPETLPFDKSFTLKYQAEFLNGYFLSRQRLLHVLPLQMKVLTEDEMVQKYNSYLPMDIRDFDHLLEAVGITREELTRAGGLSFMPEARVAVPRLQQKMKTLFPVKEPDKKALNILLMDLSQYFSSDTDMLYDVVEPPLGLMYLMTHLQKTFGRRIKGKIVKSRIDFDNYHQLKTLLEEFRPDVIGIRALSLYKDFFHRTVGVLRQWGIDVPIIAGGPYATSSYKTLLRDPNIDLVVVGEGELVLGEIIEKMLDHPGRLPGEDVLKQVQGIAYVPQKEMQDRKGVRHILMLDQLDRKPLIGSNEDSRQDSNLVSVSRPHHGAYVIYTSGSTGRPKGVIIEHRNVVRLMINDKNLFDFNSSDIWTMFHSYNFDFSVWEMYGALLYGGKLVMVPRMLARDPAKFLDLLEKERVTLLNQTPSAFYNLIQADQEGENHNLKVRYAIFGGEALSPGKLKPWREKYPGAKLINMFGITETTVHVTYKEITEYEMEFNISNIGTPIPTLTAYIMDDHLKLVPRGVPGELCVGGDGVSRGYLGMPELTAKKFVENPYNPNERLYRSGDLAVMLENGEMQYLGRIDHQVQLRGFRIELGEIECRLLDHDFIKDALVLAREDGSGNKYLCAYIVPASGESNTKSGENDNGIGLSEIRNTLSKHLPDYMIPSYFITIDNIPLTSNGKVARSALPEPKGISDEEHIAPKDDIEEALCRIWEELLEIEKVGIKDNYFQLGGDSIKAIRLLSSINQKLDGHLKIADLFVNQTIETLSAVIRLSGGQESDKYLQEAITEINELKQHILSEYNPAGSDEVDDIYPMSDIEKGMVFYSLKNSEQALYHDQFIYQMNYNNFSIERFRSAMSLMVEKHELLRSAFNMEDFGEAVQIIFKDVPLEIKHYDLSGDERPQQQRVIEKIVEEDRYTPFMISLPPLWRMMIFSLDEHHICLVWSFHHAILDGWSNASLMTELNNTYLKLQTDDAFAPERLKTSYKDYVLAEMAEKKRGTSSDFWRSELENYKRVDFSGLGKRDVTRSVLKSYGYEFDRSFFDPLKTFAQTHQTSVKNLCFAAYLFMLGMLSYDNNVVTGLISNNRPLGEDGDKVIGCFLNTVPVRIQIPRQLTWSDYIQLIDSKLVELKRYERVSFYEILRIIGEKTYDKNPLFDTMFNYVDFHVYKQAKDITGKLKQDTGDASDTGISIRGYENTNTLFDFSVSTTFDRLRITVSYSNQLVKEQNVEKLFHWFKGVLNKILHETDRFIKKDEIISSEEKQQLLYEFNTPGEEYPEKKTIHGLFEEQVERSPDTIAVVSQEIQLSYRQLDSSANRLAGSLIARGVTPGTIVAILVERSIEMITGIVGILKSGGAYLPLDPAYPLQRENYILKDASVKYLLTQSQYADRLREGYDVIDLDAEHTYKRKNTNPAAQTSANDLAYVIYTSGSTGKPKGVMLEHRSVVNLLVDLNEKYPVGVQGTYLLKTPYVFDVSVSELFGWFISGGKAAVLEKGAEKDPHKMITEIKLRQVTHINFVPSILNAFNDVLDIEGISGFNDLRYIFLAGEALKSEQANTLIKHTPGTAVENLYGPTEAAVYASRYSLSSWNRKQAIPIGTPLKNVQLYIIDKYAALQPVGVSGELCIAGLGLARGYLNKPEPTAEKFISSPFTLHLSPLYKTGDMVRWLSDGNIEFLGRIDNQVKIRGFRIELEEIETHLLRHDSIKEAMVIDREDNQGQNFLCAYIIAQEAAPQPPGYRELKEYLSGTLPDYMVPSYFVPVAEFPLTPSGKIDRKSLPSPTMLQGEDYIAPTNELEQKLVAAWAAVLNIDKKIIGIESNFFELGGHSISAVNLAAKIHKEFEVKVPLGEIFKRVTIRRLAGFIAGASKEKFMQIEPTEKKDYYKLSSAQKRMYIQQQMDLDTTSYNIPQVVRFEREPDIEKLQHTFRKLSQRHESFRTSFLMVNSEPVQRIHDRVDFDIERYDAENEEMIRAIVQRFIRPFDLARPPLIRAGLIRSSENRYFLMADMHHIISDGVSMAVLIHEFSLLYDGEEPPPLPLQYKDYSDWQNRLFRSGVIRAQQEYWLNRFKGDIPVLHLPTDDSIDSTSLEEDKFVFQPGPGLSREIHQLALYTRTTRYMTIMAAYNILLSKYTEQEDIVIGVPVFGRSHADLQNIIGMFVNMLPMRNRPQGDKTFENFLMEVKDNALAAYENQDYQFEQLVWELAKKNDPHRQLEINTVFVSENIELATGESMPHHTPELTVTPYPFTLNNSKFDLTLTMVEKEEEIILDFEYKGTLFRKKAVEAMSTHLINILHSVVKNPRVELRNIQMLNEEEENRLIVKRSQDEGAEITIPRRQGLPQDKKINAEFDF
jgi:amino acid adenylation domain-containing protein